MAVQTTIDDRKFQKALSEYKGGGRKVMADQLNRTNKDVLFKLTRIIKKAKVSEIRWLPFTTWWFGFVVNFLKNAQGPYGEEDVPEVSRRLIGKRVKAVSFLKSGAAKGLKTVGASPKQRIGSFRRVSAVGRKARVTSLKAKTTATYNVSKGSSALKINALLMAPTAMATRLAKADKARHLNRRMRELAKKHSAK